MTSYREQVEYPLSVTHWAKPSSRPRVIVLNEESLLNESKPDNYSVREAKNLVQTVSRAGYNPHEHPLNAIQTKIPVWMVVLDDLASSSGWRSEQKWENIAKYKTVWNDQKLNTIRRSSLHADRCSHITGGAFSSFVSFQCQRSTATLKRLLF